MSAGHCRVLGSGLVPGAAGCCQAVRTCVHFRVLPGVAGLPGCRVMPGSWGERAWVMELVLFQPTGYFVQGVIRYHPAVPRKEGREKRKKMAVLEINDWDDSVTSCLCGKKGERTEK